jgi:6-phosphofructokinase 1
MTQEELYSLDFNVKSLGECKIPSKLELSKGEGSDETFNYVNESDRILYDGSTRSLRVFSEGERVPISFEKAGPRKELYFEHSKTKVAIVTAGGLCPGLNNVIRGLVMQLYRRYDVKNVIGIKYGLMGFNPQYELDYEILTPDIVDRIHLQGGSYLSSSRGAQSSEMIVDTLQRENINILFCIGGDGTLRAAQSISDEIERRGLKIAVGCIPKTIDNDISFIDKSFGFETAFSQASDICINAHNEAKGAYNGIAIVKLMGRDSGFIAANTTLATGDVNFVLIPEMRFDLYGEKGLINQIKKRVEKRKHALVIVAEGAGQYFFQENNGHDASGNVKYSDIGTFLSKKIKEEFDRQKYPCSIKYIDPSYIIRSAPANSNDSKFCNQLAQNAVHAAMAGKTAFVVGHWNGSFTILPILAAVKERKRVNLQGELWWSVLESTGQEPRMLNEEGEDLEYHIPSPKFKE